MAGGEVELRLARLDESNASPSMKTGSDEFTPLKIFIKNHAKNYEKAHLARTYVFTDVTANRIAAYVTLTCSEVKADKGLVDGIQYPFGTYPAVKIARLLVDERYRYPKPYRLGKRLVNLAQAIALDEVCPAVGCRFVVVDAKRSSIGFYEHCGFTKVRSDPGADGQTVMFIDLHRAKAGA